MGQNPSFYVVRVTRLSFTPCCSKMGDIATKQLKQREQHRGSVSRSGRIIPAKQKILHVGVQSSTTHIKLRKAQGQEHGWLHARAEKRPSHQRLNGAVSRARTRARLIVRAYPTS